MENTELMRTYLDLLDEVRKSGEIKQFENILFGNILSLAEQMYDTHFKIPKPVNCVENKKEAKVGKDY